ncbi:MAG: mechanosensitive ion channel family protein [Acidimicrobiales bacterium]|nr:mechanosensitive ion channel family protein [Acidimicrobiales bacterium]
MLTQVVEPDVVDACGEEPSWVCRWVLENTESSSLATAADFLLARPAKILVILVVAWILNRLVRRAIRRFTQHLAEPDVRSLGAFSRFTPSVFAPPTEVDLRAAARAETLDSVLRSLSTAVIWVFAGLMALGQLDINLGPLIAGAGVAGVAIGFGAQSLVKDFLSGIFMLIEDQYGVGDVIDVGEAIGVVEGVTLRTTRIRGLDGSVWHVPNGGIARVGNLSQEWSRALLDIEVAYGTDLTLAREVILTVALEVQRDPAWAELILEPPEIWGIESLGADGVAIRLVVTTKPGEQWGLQRELRGRIKDTFDREGIEIPFPQRTVWFRDESGGEGSGGEGAEQASPPPEPSSEATHPEAHTAKGDRAEGGE